MVAPTYSTGIAVIPSTPQRSAKDRVKRITNIPPSELSKDKKGLPKKSPRAARQKIRKKSIAKTERFRCPKLTRNDDTTHASAEEPGTGEPSTKQRKPRNVTGRNGMKIFKDMPLKDATKVTIHDISTKMDEAKEEAKKATQERISTFKDSNEREMFFSNVPRTANKKDILHMMDINSKDIDSLRFRGEKFREAFQENKKLGARLQKFDEDENGAKNCYVVFKTVEDLNKWYNNNNNGVKPLHIRDNRISYNPASLGMNFSVYSPKKTICLRKLPSSVNDNDVFSAFAAYDPIRVRLLRNQNETIGVGFVQFKERCTVKTVLNLSEPFKIKNRKIAIEAIRSEKEAFDKMKKTVAKRIRNQGKLKAAMKNSTQTQTGNSKHTSVLGNKRMTGRALTKSKIRDKLRMKM